MRQSLYGYLKFEEYFECFAYSLDVSTHSNSKCFVGLFSQNIVTSCRYFAVVIDMACVECIDSESNKG